MSFEGKIRKRGGMIVPVRIAGPKGEISGEAMIDTGAQSTVIDDAAMRRVGAETAIVGQLKAQTVCGNIDLPIVLVALTIEGGPPRGLHFPEARLVVGRNIGHLALIGLDVLAKGTLTFDGREKVFRFET